MSIFILSVLKLYILNHIITSPCLVTLKVEINHQGGYMQKLIISFKKQKGKTKINIKNKNFFPKYEEKLLSSLFESKINKYLKELNLRNE